MIEIHRDTVAGVPALHAVPAGAYGSPLPTVLFFHGYTSSKELNAYFALMLAEAGMRAVLPDAEGHGARFDGDEARRLTRFWDILKSNIDEMPEYRRDLADRGLIADGRIAVAGASMGGFATLGGVARWDWLRAGAAYMGSGYFMTLSRTLYPPIDPMPAADADAFATRMAPLADYDISDRLEALADRPLFVWHGAKDEVVPYAESDRLLADLRSRGLADRLTFVRDRLAGHKVTMTAAEAGVAYFRQVL